MLPRRKLGCADGLKLSFHIHIPEKNEFNDSCHQKMLREVKLSFATYTYQNACENHLKTEVTTGILVSKNPKLRLRTNGPRLL